MALNRMNPDGMYTPNKGIYSQVVTSTGTTTVHIAGTVPFDEDANVVGVGDMKAQTCQILDNLRISLEAAGALPADVRSRGDGLALFPKSYNRRQRPR